MPETMDHLGYPKWIIHMTTQQDTVRNTCTHILSSGDGINIGASLKLGPPMEARSKAPNNDFDLAIRYVRPI
jgi:hypothetical protein